MAPDHRGAVAMDALDGVGAGEALVLLDDHEPRQLTELLTALGYAVATRRRDGTTWASHVALRVPAGANR